MGGQRVRARPCSPGSPREHHLTLVHYSSEYVFDGTVALDPHTEDEPLSPLGVYAQSKAAGDLAVGTTPRHYLLRTSWVIGDGHNFVRTMALAGREGGLAQRRRRPGRPAHVRLRALPGHPAPRRRRRGVRHLQRQQRRPGHVVGRPRQGGLRAVGPRPGGRHAGDDDRGRTAPARRWRPAAAAQHDVAGQDRATGFEPEDARTALRATARPTSADGSPSRPLRARSRPGAGRCRPRPGRARAGPR